MASSVLLAASPWFLAALNKRRRFEHACAVPRVGLYLMRDGFVSDVE